MEIIFNHPFWQGMAASFLERGSRIALLLVGLFIVHAVIAHVLGGALRFRFENLSSEQQRRQTTLLKLAEHFITVFFCFVAVVMVLNELSVDTTSLLAGAGIIGLAIGVGAQSLVKDFVAGFFIIAENQYSIGDFVTICEHTGTVMEVTFRTTKLRSADQVLHIIPNGLIAVVSNYTKNLYLATVRIAVEQTADPDTVLVVLTAALAALSERYASVEAGGSIGGISRMDGNQFLYEVYLPAQRTEAAAVCAAYRYEVAKGFSQKHILLSDFIVASGLPGQ
ncbi:mechanosensitive ion channel family protein [Megasphaera vaginalis (ex Bordigoni et al. 2020)]|uniref:mechanosensitive ion channel family protein n=1 Tax=Megasphaera vaginalis (ex Bordigoni et al. 2020) TaxID=2045301 RepID=UPI00190EDBED|nr:mechanosensitive ion channel domain-containing protein [Megasphaera vaginalis (ex Bordigoni et al. 2020)]